jgi:hypothetical protein
VRACNLFCESPKNEAIITLVVKPIGKCVLIIGLAVTVMV